MALGRREYSNHARKRSRRDGELVTFRRNEAARGYALANNVAHNSEMYGIATVYLRLKDQVPPSSGSADRPSWEWWVFASR